MSRGDDQSPGLGQGFPHALLSDTEGAHRVWRGHVPAVKVVEEKPFMWLGFTDASYVELAKEGVPVITADFKLYQQVIARNEESVNFTTVAFDFFGQRSS